MQFLAGAVFLTRPVRGVCPLGTLFNFIILSGVCTIALHISSLRFSTCLQLMERFYNLRNPEGPVALELPVGRGISNKMLRLRFLTIEILYILSSSILLSDFQMSTFTILWMKVTPSSAYLVLVYRRSSRRHHARLAHPLSFLPGTRIFFPFFPSEGNSIRMKRNFVMNAVQNVSEMFDNISKLRIIYHQIDIFDTT